MKKSRKVMSMFLFCAMVLGLSVPALAIENSYNELEYLGNDATNTVIIRSAADWEQMRQNDLNSYQAKIDKISPQLKADFESYMAAHAEISPVQNRRGGTDVQLLSTDLVIEDFLRAYPKYKEMSLSVLAADVELLRANIAVEAVRSFFKTMGYDFSLDLFNHSLNDNPAMIAYMLRGHEEGMYGYLRELLSADEFLSKMDDFSRESNSYERVSDSSYEFESGDLYWSIHGFTWTRARTEYGKATFTIDDRYDFDPSSIPGVVAGAAGTNDFDVYIGGVVENGVIL